MSKITTNCDCRAKDVIANVHSAERRARAYDLHDKLMGQAVTTPDQLLDFLEKWKFSFYCPSSLKFNVESRKSQPPDGGPLQPFISAYVYTLRVKAGLALREVQDATFCFPDVVNFGDSFDFEFTFNGKTIEECCKKAAFTFEQIFIRNDQAK